MKRRHHDQHLVGALMSGVSSDHDQGVRTLDAGHHYELGSLDGDCEQTLRFVKRCDTGNPKRYPGNTNSYPGATLQIVARALLDRVAYLQWQIWCPENWIATKLMQMAVWLWEFRAARRHGRSYWHGLRFATRAPICKKCGHTVCGDDCANRTNDVK